MIHWHGLLDLHHFEDALDAVATEDAQDVVFCREKELRLTRIPLPPCSPPQLIVDAARFMPLGPKDEETPQTDHIVMFLRPRLIILCKELGILFRILFWLFPGIGLGLSNGSDVSKSDRITAEQNIDTSARHVGGNSDRAFATRLGDDLRFFLMIFGIENLMLDPKLLQVMAQYFRLLNGTRTHKDGLPFFMSGLDLAENRVQLAALRPIDFIVRILAPHWTVCGDLEDIQSVYFLELVCLREGRSCHPGQLAIHLEEVLDRDCCQCLALLADLEPFLCLDGLVQSFRVATPIHESTRELIDDDDFRVLNDVLAVLPEEDLCSDGVAQDLVIFGLILQELLLRNLCSVSEASQQIICGLDALVLFIIDVVRAGRSLHVSRSHV